MSTPTLKARDEVKPNGVGFLRSGAGYYECAVVASLEPFTLVSRTGDMLWRCTIKPENFIRSGRASGLVWANVCARMSRESPTQ